MKSRIEKLLATGSPAAQEYLQKLIADHDGIDEVIALRCTHGEIGINVIDEVLVYGDAIFPNGCHDSTHIDLDTLLSIMEDNDGVPDWFDYDWFMDGETMLERGQLRDGVEGVF